jgi:hypothetical protein
MQPLRFVSEDGSLRVMSLVPSRYRSWAKSASKQPDNFYKSGKIGADNPENVDVSYKIGAVSSRALPHVLVYAKLEGHDSFNKLTV